MNGEGREAGVGGGWVGTPLHINYCCWRGVLSGFHHLICQILISPPPSGEQASYRRHRPEHDNFKTTSGSADPNLDLIDV